MTNVITLGQRGKTLIQKYEMLSLVAYLPTPNDVWTIGFGHIRDVDMGMTITRAQADRFFALDVESSIAAVALLAKKMNVSGVLSGPHTLTQSMIDALISLVFNVGPSAISSGNTIGAALIRGDYFAAWAGFALWRKQAGHDVLGLARRRTSEMQLFFEDGLPR